MLGTDIVNDLPNDVVAGDTPGLHARACNEPYGCDCRHGGKLPTPVLHRSNASRRVIKTQCQIGCWAQIAPAIPRLLTPFMRDAERISAIAGERRARDPMDTIPPSAHLLARPRPIARGARGTHGG